MRTTPRKVLGTIARCGLAWALASGCGGNEEVPPPTEEELSIFTEVFLIESALQDFTGPTKDTLTERYYGQLYDRYGVDAGELDAIRRRYNATPERWSALGDSIEARLDRAQADPTTLLNVDVK